MVRPFLARIGDCDDDSVANFERASRRNYLDAEALRRAERRFGAIYLYGYAVEMTLKAAYFRTLFVARGMSVTTKTNRKTRNDEWHLRHQLSSPASPSLFAERHNQHDIEVWALLLVWRRNNLEMGYPSRFAGQITDRATNVFRNWREYMRYRSSPVPRHELAGVREDCLWFRRNYHQL